MTRSFVVSPGAAVRVGVVRDWLNERDPRAPLLVLAETHAAGTSLTRGASHVATFGWQRRTLGVLASELALVPLSSSGKTLGAPLAIEAVCARLVDCAISSATLGRFAPVGDRPGLVRALARTLAELRVAGVSAEALQAREPDLARLLAAYVEELAAVGLADRADVLASATATLRERSVAPTTREGTISRPIVLLDLAVTTGLEENFLRALTLTSTHVLATAPSADVRSIAALERVLDASATPLPLGELGTRSLPRLQSRLFAEGAISEAAPLEGDVSILSAPGESRECVEIARRILAEAERGVPFDRMAIALRAPGTYRAHLEEALRRAGIPACFAQGTVRPDPAGRAFVTLLSCAAEHLSARRFAEYLSLGQVPARTAEGAPPPPRSRDERFVPPDVELAPRALAPDETDANPEGGEESDARDESDESDEATATLPTPRRWERLIVDAAVIGGRDRWQRRLAGLAAKLRLDLAELGDDESKAAHLQRAQRELEALTRFALPLIERLATLPARASWGEWLEQLSSLATVALVTPERVLSVLAELAPMSSIGPVDLHEVRVVLDSKLRDLVVAPHKRRAGKVLIAPIEALRGLAATVVFVPGLAEKIFPQKVVEDPILLDAARAMLGHGLEDNERRVEKERLALHLAIGAASERLVLTYPRIDAEQARPRVPSFYGLEVLRAIEGELGGFESLARRAERGGAARIAWPAPARSLDALDEAEHDLSLLAALLRKTSDEAKGAAHFLLDANPHLGRALRFRARRGIRKWTAADGLIEPIELAKAALARHQLTARSFSATALQRYSTCPYQFFLEAVHKLAPREEPEAIEEIGPLERGSLVHEVQFTLLVRLRDRSLLPLRTKGATREDDGARFEEARRLLDEALDEVAARYRDELAPAIERVWEDGVATVRADLRDWLARVAADEEWTPHRFELAFGLAGRRDRDPHSRDEAVRLDAGLAVRGSIDLVELRDDGALRATDHKTGKVYAKHQSIVGGGATLQPVLYALALEKLFPGARVTEGRLFYCTATGGYESVEFPLDELARKTLATFVELVGEALSRPFLPAAPRAGGCTYCDYLPVCGPDEEARVRRKNPDGLVSLRKVRALP